QLRAGFRTGHAATRTAPALCQAEHRSRAATGRRLGYSVHSNADSVPRGPRGSTHVRRATAGPTEAVVAAARRVRRVRQLQSESRPPEACAAQELLPHVPALLTLEDLAALRESWNLECKLAQGRDGYGALPEDIWETYSAFANTQGGDILLGLRELGPGKYELAGIPNPQKVIAEFMAGLNDTKIVSANVLCV